ncbi:MAG: aspartate dehydrogenase [Rhizobiaceae bacterium]|nr:aspartate dehydrogenase [Rhizobiaceae bacterium]
MDEKTPINLAIAGLGAIGMAVARRIDGGEVDGVRLAAVSAANLDRAKGRVADFVHPPAVLPLSELLDNADVIVECAPSAAFAELAEPVLSRGLCLMPLSVGALLERTDLVDLAKRNGGRIIVPTGALIGLDTVRAMAVGKIRSVTLETRKPPAGLAGAPHLVNNNIDISELSEPLCVLRGSAREAARGFPANVNVAAALALAGIGPEDTRVEIWADPTIDRNMQTVRIESDAGEATMMMKNIPSDENPKTGRIVANSVVATLQRLTATLTAGT